MSENTSPEELPEFLNTEPDTTGEGLICTETGERISWEALDRAYLETEEGAKKSPGKTSDYLRNIRLHGGRKGDGGKLPEKYQFLLNAPFKISDRCRYMLKKQPLKDYQKKYGVFPIVGVMADESRKRLISYLQYGCNAFKLKIPQSRPFMSWNKQDVLHYLKRFNVPYCKEIYGDIVSADLFDDGEVLKFSKAQRTGCTFCMFGAHMEEYPNRFQRMYKENPKQWNYCINYLGLGKVLEYCHIPYKEVEND